MTLATAYAQITVYLGKQSFVNLNGLSGTHPNATPAGNAVFLVDTCFIFDLKHDNLPSKCIVFSIQKGHATYRDHVTLVYRYEASSVMKTTGAAK